MREADTSTNTEELRPKKMRVLFVKETDWIKRNPGQEHHLAEKLSLRGHEIQVIDYELLWRKQAKRELCSKREVFSKVNKIYDGATVTVVRPGIIKIPLFDYASLWFTRRKETERQIKQFAPDVVISWGIFSYLAGKAAKKNNVPFICYWTDALHLLIPFKPLQPVGKILESRALKQADRVLVINDRLRAYVTKMGAHSERILVQRAGIDVEQFSPDVSGDAIRKQWGFVEEDIVLFFMGWLYNFSGLKEVALQLARNEDNRLKLLIVGEGDAYGELQKIREDHSLQDRIILTGKKPYQEIPAHVAASDICLLPAYLDEKVMQDIVPIKMYEYMALRKPVIATKLPGVMKEFGEDNGVVFVEKAEDVVETALELVASGEADELGSRARRFAERYSWDAIAGEFEGVLEQAVNERPNGP